jgi:hypothetical protein
MPVIEVQCASILVPHDHRHISHESAEAARAKSCTKRFRGNVADVTAGPYWRLSRPEPRCGLLLLE